MREKIARAQADRELARRSQEERIPDQEQGDSGIHGNGDKHDRTEFGDHPHPDSGPAHPPENNAASGPPMTGISSPKSMHASTATVERSGLCVICQDEEVRHLIFSGFSALFTTDDIGLHRGCRLWSSRYVPKLLRVGDEHRTRMSFVSDKDRHPSTTFASLSDMIFNAHEYIVH
jgi:hypothetical protein